MATSHQYRLHHSHDTVKLFKTIVLSEGKNFDDELIKAINMYLSSSLVRSSVPFTVTAPLSIPAPAPVNTVVPTQQANHNYEAHPIYAPHHQTQLDTASNLNTPSISPVSEEFVSLKNTVNLLLTRMNDLDLKIAQAVKPIQKSNKSTKSVDSEDFAQDKAQESISFQTSSLSTAFKDKFNISIVDYLTIIENTDHEQLPYDLRILVSNNVRDNPNYVFEMTQYITSYDKTFRETAIVYFKNNAFVNALSIMNTAICDYLRLRYQRLSDMQTYTMLTRTKLYDLPLCDIELLFSNLAPHSYTIEKLDPEDTYPMFSNQQRFKTAFNQIFDSCWQDKLLSFETI